MGKPDIRHSIPQNVAEFYKNDVMPRLLSDSKKAPLVDRLTQVLDGSTPVYYGYDIPGVAGFYSPDLDKIKLNRREMGSHNPDEALAHEIHHAFRDGTKTGASPSWRETYTPQESNIMRHFSLKNPPEYDPRSEIGSTAAELRYKYWVELNDLYKKQNIKAPVTVEGVNNYIDSISNRGLLLDLFNKNGYRIFPGANSKIVNSPHVEEWELMMAAGRVRSLLKHVPAISAIAVPGALATLAGAPKNQE